MSFALPAFLWANLKESDFVQFSKCLDLFRTLWEANKTIGALQFLYNKLQNNGRRRLVSHDLNCKCVGADENCFAQLVTRSTYTDKKDSILIGLLLTDADLAPELVYAAEDFAVGVQALLKIIGDVSKDNETEKKVLYN